MLAKLFLSICITKNKMNKINILLVWLFVLFINEYGFIHKSSLFLMIILGVLYYWKNRSKKMGREEKHLILLFLLYFLSFIPSFIVDVNFQWRHFDHPSRFLLYLPLIFFNKQIRNFEFLKYIFLVSTITGSLVVICNYCFWDVHRGFCYTSCISGAQHIQVLGLFALLTALNHHSNKYLYAGWTAYLLSNIAVLCSESRGVILCIPILFFIVMYFSLRKINYFKLASLCIAFLGLLIFVIFSVPSLKVRMVSFVSDVETLWIHKGVDQESKTNRNISSALHRFELLHYGLKAFAHNPLLGSGRSGYLDEMLKAGYPKAHTYRATHSHNQYLSALAMRGLLGFSILLFFILSLLKIFLNYHKSGHSAYSLCGIIFIVAYLLYFLTDSPLIGSMHASRFFIFMVFLLFYSCKADLDLKRGHEY